MAVRREPRPLLVGLEDVATAAHPAVEAPREDVLVRPVGEGQGDLGRGRPVADQVGGLDLGEAEERHLDRVEDRRLAGPDVPPQERRPRAEGERGVLEAAEVADPDRSELHGPTHRLSTAGRGSVGPR